MKSGVRMDSHEKCSVLAFLFHSGSVKRKRLLSSLGYRQSKEEK